LTRIEPRRGLGQLQLAEIWRHGGLLWFLVWRDLKLRYKQAAFGIAWVVLQPVLMMLIFTIFFGHLIHVPSEGLPYPVFLYAGLLPWTMFANSLSKASQSLVSDAHLITKVYFPRVLLPVASTLGSLVDFTISFIVLVALMIHYRVPVSAHIVFVLGFVLMAMVAALAASLWLGALNVRYRDVQATLPFIVQFWFFATPIVYPSELVKGVWRSVYRLNPMVSVIDGFRWALLGSTTPRVGLIAVSAAVAVAGLIGGLIFFRSLERSFADWV
jgi:lipopolysaccharide transport system permease protein